jgi:ABC-type sugar transport system substrate-binding protein
MHLAPESWIAGKERTRRTLLTLSTVVALAACSGSTATGPASATPATGASASVAPASQPASTAASSASAVAIGFAQAHLSDPFQQVLLKQLQQQTTTQGGTWAGAANANDDPAKQVTDMSTLISKGAKSLLVVPIDAKAIIPAIDSATAAGVPVVSIDGAPDGGKVAMVVRANNVKMGDTACQEMGKLLNGAGTVLELQGALGSAGGLQRTQGFGDCMKANFPNVKIKQVATDWLMEKATTGAQTILSTEDVNGIYWASDFFFPGIKKVLQDNTKWKKVGEPGHVAIVGIDGTQEALQAIRDGYQDATVSQPLDLYAKYGALYAIGAAAGQTWADGPTDHDSSIVTTNGIPADNLTAALVTTANVDDPTLWANQLK